MAALAGAVQEQCPPLAGRRTCGAVISGVALEGQQAAASARRVKTKPVRMPWRRFADA